MTCENCKALLDTNSKLLDDQLKVSADLVTLQKRVRELGEELLVDDPNHLLARFSDLFEACHG